MSYAEKRLSCLALIVVDMQNDFVRVGAPLEVPKARDTIAAHIKLLAAFRSRNLPVVTPSLSACQKSIRFGTGHRNVDLPQNAVGKGISDIIQMSARNSTVRK